MTLGMDGLKTSDVEPPLRGTTVRVTDVTF